jgi:membrane-associated phospholipid phosphatase
LVSGLVYDEGEASISLQYRGRSDETFTPIVHMIRPNAADFAKQAAWVFNYAALRVERSSEILAELHDITSFLGSVGYVNPSRSPRTAELLALVLQVTTTIEMRIKHALTCRRPIEYSPQIQPMIQTPGHGSLPSGHATESFATAFVINALIRKAKTGKDDVDTGDPLFVQLMRHAERIAINRTVAGLHFPVDSVAGMVLGWVLAEFFIARCSGTAQVTMRKFDGRGFDDDFRYEDVLTMSYRRSSEANNAVEPGGSDLIIQAANRACAVPCSPLLQHLWTQALAECRLIVG